MVIPGAGHDRMPSPAGNKLTAMAGAPPAMSSSRGRPQRAATSVPLHMSRAAGPLAVSHTSLGPAMPAGCRVRNSSLTSVVAPPARTAHHSPVPQSQLQQQPRQRQPQVQTQSAQSQLRSMQPLSRGPLPWTSTATQAGQLVPQRRAVSQTTVHASATQPSLGHHSPAVSTSTASQAATPGVGGGTQATLNHNILRASSAPRVRPSSVSSVPVPRGLGQGSATPVAGGMTLGHVKSDMGYLSRDQAHFSTISNGYGNTSAASIVSARARAPINASAIAAAAAEAAEAVNVAEQLQGQHATTDRSEETAKTYGQHVEVRIADHRFRCLNVLGRGSYSEVWRAEVLTLARSASAAGLVGGLVAGTPVSSRTGVQEAALKEVRCTNQMELQQAIFEVQVLLALERAAEPVAQAFHRPPRIPRCVSYEVEPCGSGWRVRTAMTVVPGEPLDAFLRHPPVAGVTRAVAIQRGVALATKLIRDIGPTLEMLSPIAWHRDVNSHNVLIDGLLVEKFSAGDDPRACAERAEFWLIDFGLAIDSQSWVTANGRWKTEYIGGDSRYWPASSWIMHLLGPEGFAGREKLCEQYQRRLDIHGLGITALELLCSVGMSYSDNTGPNSERPEDPWDAVFASWHEYRDSVWAWWSAVYSVFSSGGDIAPVQAKLLQDNIIEQLISLLTRFRDDLRRCAASESAASMDTSGAGMDRCAAPLLRVIADMIDEYSDFELSHVEALIGRKTVATVKSSLPLAVMPPLRHQSPRPPHPTAIHPLRALSPTTPSAEGDHAQRQQAQPQGSLCRHNSPSAVQMVAPPWPAQCTPFARPSSPSRPVLVRPISPIRSGATTGVMHMQDAGHYDPRGSSPNRARSPVRQPANVMPLQQQPQHQHQMSSHMRSESPCRWSCTSPAQRQVSAAAPLMQAASAAPSVIRPEVGGLPFSSGWARPQWTGVVLPTTVPSVPSARATASSAAAASSVGAGPLVPAAPQRSNGRIAPVAIDVEHSFNAGVPGFTPPQQRLCSQVPFAAASCGLAPPIVTTTWDQPRSRAFSLDRAAGNVLSPRDAVMFAGNTAVSGGTHVHVGAADASAGGGSDRAQKPSTPPGYPSCDGDLGAGPPVPQSRRDIANAVPVIAAARIVASITAQRGVTSSTVLLGGAKEGDDDGIGSTPITSLGSQEALKERIKTLEASGDEHEKLRDRIRSLEESLQKLERESLERAKLGMEKLAEKYFPRTPHASGGTTVVSASSPPRGGEHQQIQQQQQHMLQQMQQLQQQHQRQ